MTSTERSFARLNNGCYIVFTAFVSGMHTLCKKVQTSAKTHSSLVRGGGGRGGASQAEIYQ